MFVSPQGLKMILRFNIKSKNEQEFFYVINSNFDRIFESVYFNRFGEFNNSDYT